jgi:hypothetical protein
MKQIVYNFSVPGNYLKRKFCRVYNSFTGKNISRPEEITNCNLNGNQLKDLCEEYHKSVLGEECYNQFKSDLIITRILWFVIGALVAFVSLFLQTYFE